MKDKEIRRWKHPKVEERELVAPRNGWADDPMDGTCLNCKQEYRKSHRIQKYCSPQCSHQAARKKEV